MSRPVYLRHKVSGTIFLETEFIKDDKDLERYYGPIDGVPQEIEGAEPAEEITDEDSEVEDVVDPDTGEIIVAPAEAPVVAEVAEEAPVVAPTTGKKGK